MVTVGMPVTRHPPYRSRRALLPHRAPTSGADVQIKIGIWMHHTDFGQPAVRKLGFSATELSKKLGISQPSVSFSVKRGEKIAKAEHLEPMEHRKLKFYGR